MVYGCGNQFIKFLVFTSNLLLFVFGGLIFGISLWANLDQNFPEHLAEFAKQAKIDERFVEDLSQYQASLWVLVVVGALLFLVGFLGCCGAACESIVSLTLFFVIVMILSVIELFTLVFMFSNRAEMLNSLHHLLAKSAETAEGRRNLLPVEKALRCCGATVETAHAYQEDCSSIGLIGTQDCYTAISEKLETMGEVVLAVGIILLVVQAFSMIFSCVLCRAFRERGPSYYA